ncbi:MAG: IS3 family transposase [SAR86 cluster bacterium]|uniref:IS3 family transposase n=1 Tax=SAR86 cluster bacterium TaxID=2030880 RepID=A0A2A5AJI6_9GAMM|nr:MAG: IS3 family transposase [SAR86 cluster bacterium]
MRFAFVAEHSNQHSTTRLCLVMKVSRRGYYGWLNRPDSQRTLANRELLIKIKHLFYQHREVYGAPRICRALLKQEIECGLNRVAQLMRDNEIVPKTVKKFRVTTDSRKSRHPAKNILDRKFSADRPNEKWVADVTYIPTREGWLFLATVLDLYSRKIVGWSMSDRLLSELAQKALQSAIDARRPAAGLIVHSDRGKEYYAGEYQQLLKKYSFVCSMSRRGDCWDNAVMESFFHSMKVEEIHHHDFKTRAEARTTLFDYIEIFYNRQRLHSSIGYQSPIEFEQVA